MSFLTPGVMSGRDWSAVERAVARTMSHCGWKDVRLVGGSGDRGADVLAVRPDKFGDMKSWVVQVKAISSSDRYVGNKALQESLDAQSYYSTSYAAVATNGDFTDAARVRQAELLGAGYDLKLWNGAFLTSMVSKWPEWHHDRRTPRPYQGGVLDALKISYAEGSPAGQFVMATGLGKTVVAAEFVRHCLDDLGMKRGLVLSNSQDLSLQLERAFWPHMKSSEATSVFMDGSPINSGEGLAFGVYKTMLGYLPSIPPDLFDVLVVDEAHNALAGDYEGLLSRLRPKYMVGMTATPWRGDGDSIDRLFGRPLATVSLVDGMSMGYLAQVDYRMFCDNIDWKAVPRLSGQNLNIKDLNRRLFLPQRDDAAVAKIAEAAREVTRPKIIVFSPSIAHATQFAKLLCAAGLSAKCVSSLLPRSERQAALMDLSAGRLSAICAVDSLNEGIDIADVNIIAFMRASHSRRIFIQQLGRGLRIADDKDKVIVLDFVSDIRRLSEVVDMNNEAKSSRPVPEAIYLNSGFVSFSDGNVESFIEEWIADAANLVGGSSALQHMWN